MTRYPAPSPPYVGPCSRTSGTGNKPITRIVMHGTVSPTEKGGARKIALYFRSAGAGGSAHYIVDPGETVQAAYDSVVCWHAPPNSHSIGIELCDWVGVGGGSTPCPMSRWDEPPHAAMLRRAAKLAAQLCLAYELPTVMLSPSDVKLGRRGICEHSDVSQAFGESSHWDLGNFPRERFLRMVRAEAAAIRRGDDEGADVVKASRVTKARDLLQAALRNAKQPKRRDKIAAGLHALPEE